MDDLVSRLRSYGDPDPPCAPERLRALPGELGFEIDPFLLELYAGFDGQQHTWRTSAREGGTEEEDVGFRLMPVADVVELYRVFQDRDRFEFPTYAWCAFWTNDNSDYMACYTEGPLRGKVCILEHDGDRFVPRFRSARSFCAALLKAADEGGRINRGEFRDYPVVAPPPEGDDAADTALSLRLIEACRESDDPDQQGYLAACAADLLPYHDADLLLSLAGDENAYVRDAVDALLEERERRRRLRAGLPRLADLLRAGAHVRNPDARREVLALLREFSSVLHGRELRGLGVEVQHQRKGYRYRASPDAPWEFLPHH